MLRPDGHGKVAPTDAGRIDGAEPAVPLVLRRARIPGRPGLWQIGIAGGRIAALTRDRASRPDPDGGIDLGARTALPGFHDAHVHVLSAARERDAPRLPATLRSWAQVAAQIVDYAASQPQDSWLSVRRFDPATMTSGWLPDRRVLDELCPGRPLRLRHRNLRLDLLNSAALERCALSGPSLPDGVECDAAGHPTGRLHQLGHVVRAAQGRAAMWSLRDGVRALSQDFFAHGVTSLQDAGEHNGLAELALLDELASSGVIGQRLWTMASSGLVQQDPAVVATLARVRHVKLAPVEGRIEPDVLCEAAVAAHSVGLGVAAHATSEAELAAAISAIRVARATIARPSRTRDRIEHACVATEALVAAVAECGAAVVANPALVREAGDSYMAEFDRDEHRLLHRLASWRAAGVALAVASDAPVTTSSPLEILDAACSRRTEFGAALGLLEALDPTAALGAITVTPALLIGERELGRVAVGALADIVVVDGHTAQRNGSAVAMTLSGGRLVFCDPSLGQALTA